ncbi:MAG TPA: ATP-dependent Clp protease ATP-binding subunit, partial [Polyangiales bacterium]|nr:ATP-dependent Clp protease ATP-binding subunit [Polyangiales bacterium]
APSPEDWSLDAERFPLLAGLGLNLSALAANGKLDPVVGREPDVQRVMDVLARRRANNPVLVGPPGVGKTAIAHGLAHAFVRGVREQDAPQRLLIELSASSLLSGTGVRGALSERVQRLRAEVAGAAGRVLLFIDELHGLLGAGEADSLANELKTALAQGELPLMGATTDGEYRRVFERDPALARRFTRVDIAEPSPEAALEMLQLIAPHYAEHHGVQYEPDALAATVSMSVRYLPLRQLPDKAIALMDQAGARAQRSGSAVVDVAAVAAVVSELVAVPAERLLMQDGQALLALEQELARRVVGQSAAIGCIANALRKSAAGFRGARPLGTFLFTGPTGVGKTEMARAISEVLFPGIAWTRIDMSELGQAHGVARLLGAPPGYLGHDEGGQLTEAVRSRPYQLVLLDEIEKAHLEVLMTLLPLLDEGRLTDGRGRTVDFTNTVIVMTSNLGAECAAARGRIGFDGGQAADPQNLRDQALSAVRAALPPELYNRIDEPLYFAPLSREDVAEIARRMLTSLADVTRERHQVELAVDDTAIDALIAAGGFDRALGARPMRRTIGRLVEAPLARAVLARELEAGTRVVLRGHGTRIEFATSAKATRAAR